MKRAFSAGTRHALVAAAGFAALAFASPPTSAQPYDAGYYRPEVQVIAPRPRPETNPRLGAPPEKISLSQSVPFGDLDLTTWRGAHALRERVRETAYDVCTRLRDYAPHRMPGTPSCYREAVSNGLVRADEAIASTRQNYREAVYEASY